jgi:hypothetical protein
LAYDEPKIALTGERYTGMRIGAEHAWRYTGEWREAKVAPDQWHLRFQAVKRRRVAAPEESGAPAGAAFDWLIVASQRAHKVDANAYETLMTGVKWKLGTRFPAENLFTYDRRGVPRSDVVTAYLQETLDLVHGRKLPGLRDADTDQV